MTSLLLILNIANTVIIGTDLVALTSYVFPAEQAQRVNMIRLLILTNIAISYTLK